MAEPVTSADKRPVLIVDDEHVIAAPAVIGTSETNRGIEQVLSID